MSQELGEAMQIVRTSVEGVPMVIKGTYKGIQDFIKFIFLLYKKTAGKEKEKIKQFMSQPGEKQFLVMNDKELEEITKNLDSLKIQYVKVPDFNEADGKSTIMFHANDYSVIERIVKGKENEIYKNFEEYHKVYGENWTKEMEEIFREKANLPTVEIASIVNEKGNITPAELKAELSKSGKFTDEQINLAVEDAIKDNLIKADNVGNYGSVENFNDTLSKHYEKTALMRGRAFKADDRFESAVIDERMRLSDTEISKWELPENDPENGLLLSYYKLPNTGGKQIVGIPKEHICGTLYPGSKIQSNEVFIGKSSRYKIYDISENKLKKLEDKRGSQLKEKYFSRKVDEGSGIAKEKTKEKTKDTNKSRTDKDGR